jgi:hypothetical protein
MAKFGWAYVNCETETNTAGPTGSLQFLTGTNSSSGSVNLMFYTASVSPYAEDTLFLKGTLVVTGTISASHFHIEDVTRIDSTGSTTFGNTNDDRHIRTGSLYIGEVDAVPLMEVSTTTDQVIFNDCGHRVNYDAAAAASQSTNATSHIVGITRTGDVLINLHSASGGGIGQVLVIKDELTSVRSGVITISASVPAGGFKVDGATHYELSGTMPAINLYSNGTNWFVY